LAEVARERGIDVRTYGEAAEADLRLDGLVVEGQGSSFDVVWSGRRLGELRLRVPGAHNASNAAAALLAGLGLGLPFSELAEGLAAFTGARRRFEPKGTIAGVSVYDDYAHHPTEIAVTLRAARAVVGEGRLIVAFQAHHYYRTADFCTEFGEALGLADDVVVMEVYAPGEDLIAGGTGSALTAAVPLPAENVIFEPLWSRVPEHLVARAQPGDVVMTIGAGGEVAMLAPEVLAALAALESTAG
jgi:UDP-N-acetylmuramate--alanine ligase